MGVRWLCASVYRLLTMADYFKDGGPLIIDAMPEPLSCLMPAYFQANDCCAEMWNDINFVVFIAHEMAAGLSYDEYSLWII